MVEELGGGGLGRWSSEGGQAVVWLVMVEEARPEVGLRASHAMAMLLYNTSHISNMQIVTRMCNSL